MAAPALSTAALRGLLADLLAGAAGGERQRWFECVGKIQVLPIALNPRCNWRATPTGSPSELDAISRAIALVREEHPYISAN